MLRLNPATPDAVAEIIARLDPSYPAKDETLNTELCRVLSFLELSRRATQAAFASQTLAEQSLETRLADLPPKTPLSCAPGTPLAEALGTMHERRVVHGVASPVVPS